MRNPIEWRFNENNSNIAETCKRFKLFDARLSTIVNQFEVDSISIHCACGLRARVTHFFFLFFHSANQRWLGKYLAHGATHLQWILIVDCTQWRFCNALKALCVRICTHHNSVSDSEGNTQFLSQTKQRKSDARNFYFIAFDVAWIAAYRIQANVPHYASGE